MRKNWEQVLLFFVFLLNIFGKEFLETFLEQRIFGTENREFLEQIIFGTKMFWEPIKVLEPIKIWKKIFGNREFLEQRMFGTNNFWKIVFGR